MRMEETAACDCTYKLMFSTSIITKGLLNSKLQYITFTPLLHKRHGLIHSSQFYRPKEVYRSTVQRTPNFKYVLLLGSNYLLLVLVFLNLLDMLLDLVLLGEMNSSNFVCFTDFLEGGEINSSSFFCFPDFLEAVDDGLGFWGKT